jgi:hypothetical protein
MDQEVTEHPVETGFEIHDSIINKAIKVDMTIGISSHPVTWFYKNSHGQHKFASGLSALEQIRDNKEPVTIVRPDKIWSDMVLTSARPVRNDESKSIIWVNCSFVHITKVATQTTEVPEDIVDESARIVQEKLQLMVVLQRKQILGVLAVILKKLKILEKKSR